MQTSKVYCTTAQQTGNGPANSGVVNALDAAGNIVTRHKTNIDYINYRSHGGAGGTGQIAHGGAGIGGDPVRKQMEQQQPPTQQPTQTPTQQPTQTPTQTPTDRKAILDAIKKNFELLYGKQEMTPDMLAKILAEAKNNTNDLSSGTGGAGSGDPTGSGDGTTTAADTGTTNPVVNTPINKDTDTDIDKKKETDKDKTKEQKKAETKTKDANKEKTESEADKGKKEEEKGTFAWIKDNWIWVALGAIVAIGAVGGAVFYFAKYSS